LKTIDYKEFESQLEKFCRYIFEEVFDNMITGSEAILTFNIENSPLKLFPCLLKGELISFIFNSISISQ
jgi:hypothetical protein